MTVTTRNNVAYDYVDGIFYPMVRTGSSARTRTSRSGTITTGATAQALAVANTSRQGFMVQNQSSGYLYVNEIGGTAIAGQPSIAIPPGGYWTMEAEGVSTDAISIIGATTGQAFAAREW